MSVEWIFGSLVVGALIAYVQRVLRTILRGGE